MMLASLPDWLSQRAALTPERPALSLASERMTWSQLEQRVSAAAAFLVEAGVRPGDRVAVLARNGLPFVLLAHAVPRAGGILVPLNTRLVPPEHASQLEDVGARLLVYDANHANHIPDVIPSIEADSLLRAAGSFPGRPVSLDDVHSIIFTSGTTGRAKGAMLTFGNFWWSAMASALNLGIHTDDRWLAVLPLFHVGGLSILTRSTLYGITTVVHERFDPAAVSRAIDEQEITMVSLVSAMLQRLLDARGDRPFPASLRCVLLGGGPAPLPLLQRCAALRAPIIQTYGLTETTSQVATLAPDDALRKLGSAGKPLFGNELRIDADPGEVGEILVRGPIVTAGYYNQPEASARALHGGWLHTGDLGYLDRDGYLYVLNRRDDLIISGGENVYPAEIEAVLVSHPAVAEAAVAGIPDERWGEVPAAAITLHPGQPVTEEELLALCRQKLAGYKVPVRIKSFSELPRNAGGKVLRRELRNVLLSVAD